MDNYTAINFVVIVDNIFNINIGTLGITWKKFFKT